MRDALIVLLTCFKLFRTHTKTDSRLVRFINTGRRIVNRYFLRTSLPYNTMRLKPLREGGKTSAQSG